MSAFFKDVAAAWESAREAARERLSEVNQPLPDDVECIADVTPRVVIDQGENNYAG